MRFLPSMTANSGKDPKGAYVEFLKKDPYKNIDVRRDAAPPKPDISHMSKRWAVGTMKDTKWKANVEDGLLDRKNLETKTFPRSKTDHLSFDPPANDRPF